MKILFLGGNLVMTGYHLESPELIKVCSPNDLAHWLKQQGEDVVYTENKVTLEDVRAIRPGFIISYNYRYILPKEVINEVYGNAINLHISFLPYNRGYHPYVWCFLENTPVGVTIHYMDEGIDSGDILVQREVPIEETETLRSAFETLHREIQILFKEEWNRIKNRELTPQAQGLGNIHFKREFARFEPLIKEKGWDTSIREIKVKYNTRNSGGALASL